MNNNQLLQSALGYAEQGYPVFPCLPNGKAPLTNQGFHDASTDAEQIEKWWKENPNANIGLPTEGLFVVDVDGSDNYWPNDPDKTFELSHGAVASTPRGGAHYFFRQPEGGELRNTTGKIADRVDTRANGGYVVVSPSVVGEKPYQWLEGLELLEPEQLPEPPAWVIDALNSESTGNIGPILDAGNNGNKIPDGQRNDTLARLAGVMRRNGMGMDEIAAALQVTNKKRCSPQLKKQEVEKIAQSVSRYEPDQISVATIENHWAQDAASIEPDETAAKDPGPLPIKLLRVPGFVSQVMDCCLESAPYPNQVLAFCGALALQSFLAGRKVRDSGDCRTNIYLLGLAHSAAGKDWPRKINTNIMHQVGLSSCLGESFASGEGLQDALNVNPSMLFHTDEVDGMLQSINKSKDARYETIMGGLLTMYSSANSIFPLRRKAGQEASAATNQPCLSISGTAIPNHYYEALSGRMLTNGLFSRMMIFESGRRSSGQRPKAIKIPVRILEVAKWWSNFRPGTGNLENWSPAPVEVDNTTAAEAAIVEMMQEADFEYSKCELAGDVAGTTVWGRVNENVCKLALIYAISENPQLPQVSDRAVKWAREVVCHQARRMLFMAQSHVADNPFHGECNRLLGIIRSEPDKRLGHSALLRRMRVPVKTLIELVSTLEQSGQIITTKKETAGRPVKQYAIPLIDH